MKRLLPLLLLLVLVVQSTYAQEPYAVLSDDNTKLTFYYDTNKESRNGMSVGPFSYSNMPGWSDATSSITTVVFDSSFANCSSITSTAEWFWHCYNLTTVTGIENFNTSNVTSMAYMFCGCFSLTSLNVSHFNTSKVTNMSQMFAACFSLTSLDVSTFDTSNVIDMHAMFPGCSSLTSLDVSSFNTSNVTDMTGMFADCASLTSLDVSHFNTSKVTYMGSMFSGCSGLTSLDVSNFDTSKVTDMGVMFSGCSGLTSIDLSHFDTSNVSSMYMYNMFEGCINLRSITIGKDITKIGDRAFWGCSNLNDVYCYAAPKSFTWEESDNSDCFKPQKGTLFHVYKKSDWEEKFPNANVTFVGDLRQKANTNAIIRGSETEYWSSFYDSSENFKADEGIKVYIVKIVGDALVLEQVADRIINKGQGVLLKSTTENVSLAYSEAESSADYSGNSLLGTDVEITNPGNAYVLNSKTAGLGFYKLSATGKILANKAYLVNNSGDARSFMAFDDETVTGIKSVEQSRLSSDGVFNLKGQRVSHPSKGLYVVNGKKVMIK